MADIARRAGVVKGTVFHHFPTKDALLAAIILDRIGPLTADAQRLAQASDPGAALLEFMTIAGGRREQRDLSFLQQAGELNHEVAAARTELYRAIDVLVTRAREADAIRADVTSADVILLMCAPNYVASYVEDSGQLWRRYLGIIFDGLRPEGAHTLGEQPPRSL